MVKLDLLIYSLPRSGSTMLCNLLTYGKNRCISEPNGELPEEVFWEDYTKLGAKEVYHQRWELVNRLYQPRIHIFLIRDLVPAMHSWINLIEYNSKGNDRRVKFPCQIVNDYIKYIKELDSAYLESLNNPDVKTYLIRYEQLLSPVFRKRLGKILNWELKGNPATGNLIIDRDKRIDVKPRHWRLREDLYEEIEARAVFFESYCYRYKYKMNYRPEIVELLREKRT